MAEETKESKESREAQARRDADETAKWDKMFGALDAICSRMDTFEETSEKARKAADEFGTEREKSLRDELENLKSHVNAQPSDRSDFGAAQARADSVYRLDSKQAPPPMAGETPLSYRKRLLAPLQSASKQFSKVNLRDATADVIDALEGAIYSDAAAGFRDGSSVPVGMLRKIERRDDTGRRIVEYVGDQRAWMSAFMAPSLHFARFNGNHAAQH